MMMNLRANRMAGHVVLAAVLGTSSGLTSVDYPQVATYRSTGGQYLALLGGTLAIIGAGCLGVTGYLPASPLGTILVLDTRRYTWDKESKTLTAVWSGKTYSIGQQIGIGGGASSREYGERNAEFTLPDACIDFRNRYWFT